MAPGSLPPCPASIKTIHLPRGAHHSPAISGHSLGFGERQEQAINALPRRGGGLRLWLEHGDLPCISNTFIEFKRLAAGK